MLKYCHVRIVHEAVAHVSAINACDRSEAVQKGSFSRRISVRKCSLL
jgi:hypothetical protein